jgi:hypothetical protein
VLSILFFLLDGVVSARDASLTNIIVTNTRDDLLVYLTVERGLYSGDGESGEKRRADVIHLPCKFTQVPKHVV